LRRETKDESVIQDDTASRAAANSPQSRTLDLTNFTCHSDWRLAFHRARLGDASSSASQCDTCRNTTFDRCDVEKLSKRNATSILQTKVSSPGIHLKGCWFSIPSCLIVSRGLRGLCWGAFVCSACTEIQDPYLSSCSLTSHSSHDHRIFAEDRHYERPEARENRQRRPRAWQWTIKARVEHQSQRDGE
jgi:hypothetical protein